MKKPIIFAIDIDETLASAFIDGKILDEYYQKTGKNISLSELTDYYFECMPWIDDIYYKYLDEFHDKLPLFDNAKKVLTALKQKWIQLIIITSREKPHQEGTKRFIFEIFWKNFFDKIIFTSDFPEDNKAIIVKNENCNIVIDDALHHIDRYLAETDMMILKFSASWNQKKYDSHRIIEINNWNEVETFFGNFFKQ